MYKVLIPLPGYAYITGTVTKHISPKDVERFLKLKFIEPVKEEKPVPSKPVGKKESDKK